MPDGATLMKFTPVQYLLKTRTAHKWLSNMYVRYCINLVFRSGFTFNIFGQKYIVVTDWIVLFYSPQESDSIIGKFIILVYIFSRTLRIEKVW